MDRICQACGKPFEGRSNAKNCSNKCRQKSMRRRVARDGKPAPVAPVVALPGRDKPKPLVLAIEKQLTKAERLDTPAGQMALVLAERLAAGLDTGSALATLSRELTARMAEALAGATIEPDELDELAERRLRKVSGG